MRRRAIRVIAAVLALQLVAAGCGSVRLHSSPPIVQGNFPDDHLARENKRRLTKEFQLEWNLRGRPGRPPGQCLALSGGGIRSAAFSTGALKALHSLGLLEKMDVMSAVSGGAYALSWYYAGHLEHEHDAARDAWLTGAAGPDGVPVEVGPVARLDDKGFVGIPEYVALAIANTLAAPWNLFANGLFGWHLNTTPARPYYELRIRDTFHGGREMAFEEVRALIQRRNLPTFVINTTAYVDDDRGHLGGRLSNTVFEFTPLRYGSAAFGYNNKSFPFSVGRAVSISGAALDSSVVAGSTQKTLVSLLNQDLNYTIPNFPVNFEPESSPLGGLLPEPAPPSVHNALPFPFYFFSGRYQWDAEGIRIHLADGGHAENLGAFALVRRLCQRIVIVDAEHDPEYVFNAYFKLKAALRAEFGVDLSLPVLDRFFVETPRRVSINRQRSPGDRAVQYTEGTIRWFPMPGAPDQPDQRLEIQVAYIKLALTQADVDSGTYLPTVTEYWKRSRAGFEWTADVPNKCRETDFFLRACVFPQESTAHQDFDGAQFKAYRDLADQIVKDNAAQIRRVLSEP